MSQTDVASKGRAVPPSERTPLTGGCWSGERKKAENFTCHWADVRRVLDENDKALAYTFFTTLATVPTLLFASLHMLAFLDMHDITTTQVATAHVLFMIWNTCNDIFAGYATDWYATRIGTRLGLVCIAQAVWVATTFGPFLPVPSSVSKGACGTLYYLACISLQDGCLSLVGVARTALMAEITTTEGECIHLKRLNAILGCTEALVNLGGYALWSARNPWPFLAYLAGISCLALLVNFLSAARLRRYLPQSPASRVKEGDKPALPPIMLFIRSMPGNAWVFIAISALHEMQGVAWGQFAIPLMEALLVDVAKFWRVLLLGGISSVAGVIAFLMTWPAERTGLYVVLLWTFRVKVVLASGLGMLIWMQGLSNALIALSMLLNECTMAMVSGFRLVVLVSVVDELAALRSSGAAHHPLAAYPGACGAGLLVGVSAFFVKPFNSVGPVVGTALLSGDAAKGSTGRLRAASLLIALPLVTGLGQWLLWGRYFTLRGRGQPSHSPELAAADGEPSRAERNDGN